MIKKILLGTSLSFLLLGVSVSVQADTVSTLTSILKAKFKAAPSSIKKSPLDNLYEVMYGTEIVYVSADGKYFISGDMIDLQTNENISNAAKTGVIKSIMKRQDNKPVVFKAKDEKQVLTVFTDIDCPYCAKLHREVPQLNQSGITVEYLMFPRAGLGSPSFKKAVSMWCAEDNNKSMTEAKEGRPIENKTCENPIKAQYQLGQEIGVNGTPALITSTGKLIPGYVPVDRLVKMLGVN